MAVTGITSAGSAAFLFKRRLDHTAERVSANEAGILGLSAYALTSCISLGTSSSAVATLTSTSVLYVTALITAASVLARTVIWLLPLSQASKFGLLVTAAGAITLLLAL
jgi:hypothetical protein